MICVSSTTTIANNENFFVGNVKGAEFPKDRYVDIDENGANSGFQLAVVDETPANVVWTLDDANPGAEQGAFALSADGELTFLNGVPAYDGTAAENNDYEVRVKAVDENGLSSTKLITVTVNDALAPTIALLG